MEGDDAPFFVVGNDRSGTTLLRLVLDRSAEAAVPPESMFLLDFAPVRRRGRLSVAGTSCQLPLESRVIKPGSEQVSKEGK